MSFYKEVPGLKKTLESTLKFDTEPKAGSTNPVTSDGVKTAIDGAVGNVAENLQQQIDGIAEKAGSGYIPKGEATVAILNGLSGQENGWLYTMTDAGTLTDGTLAVVAGDTVAWDEANSVWYKVEETPVKSSVIDFVINNGVEAVLAIINGFLETKNIQFKFSDFADFMVGNGNDAVMAISDGMPIFKNLYFSELSNGDFGIAGKDGKFLVLFKDGQVYYNGKENNYFSSSKNYGKSVGVFGGSLSVYPESQAAKNLWRKYLNLDITDYGVGGAGFSSLQGTTPIQTQVDNAAKKDIYILWASTNDYTNSRQIGEYSDYTYLDNYDSSKLTTQCGGINYCIKKLYEKNPMCEIYFFTGIDFFSQEGGYNPFTEQTNTIGKTYQEYVDAQKKCCEFFSIPVLDQNAMSGLNIFNYTNYFKSDNLHMKEIGYLKVSMQQVQFLANGI